MSQFTILFPPNLFIMNKNKYLTLLVGLLVVLNVLVLSFVVLKKPHRPNFPPERHPLEKDLLHRMKLGDDQLATLEKSKETYKAKSRNLHQELNEVSIQYYSANIEDSVRENAHRKIIDLTDEIYQVNLDHFEELRSLCTPSQIEIMEEFIEALIRRKDRRPPQRR